MNGSPPPSAAEFSERFLDPSSARAIVVLRWNSNWNEVRAETSKGELPPITDLSVLEGAGIVADVPEGVMQLRIDRRALHPKFHVTLDGRVLRSTPEDRLSADAQRQLTAAVEPISGSDTRDVVRWVGALVLATVAVIAVIALAGAVA